MRCGLDALRAGCAAGWMRCGLDALRAGCAGDGCASWTRWSWMGELASGVGWRAALNISSRRRRSKKYLPEKKREESTRKA